MEGYFATFFENVRNEKSLLLLLSSTDEGILGQTGFTDHEIKRIKNLALKNYVDKKHGQNFLLYNF